MLCWFLIAVSAVIFIASFIPFLPFANPLLHALEMRRVTSGAASLILLICAANMLGRKQMAWQITFVILLASMIRHLATPHGIPYSAVAIIEAALLAALFAVRRDFCWPSQHRSIRQGILLLAAAFTAILLNAGIMYHYASLRIAGVSRNVLFWESFQEAFSILFGETNNNAPGLPGVAFERTLFAFSWIMIFFAVLLFLKPWIERRLWTEHDMERARKLVLQYGQNPESYLTLERDKLLYFGQSVQGVVPYGIVGSTVVVNGDPIASPEDFEALLSEFRSFCTRSNHRLIILSITGDYLKTYQRLGFGTVKCGEEARFDLASYDITGRKGAKMRMNINHARKAGITVSEYQPLKQRDPEIEEAMSRISREWLSGKIGSMLVFTIGSVGLDNPMDRRYFYARNSHGDICAFNVYCPFNGGKGYMADITRRAPDAPGGVTETINYDAFLQFQSEGVREASLGIAPLANLLQGGSEPGPAERFLNFIYEHLNACYGFKNLYQTKKSYSPTAWLPGYYAWYPRIPVPEMFYAIVKIQNPKGILDYVRPVLSSLGSRSK